jgi:Zn finger protein HypA/HybF involved in hydrogenase expression
MSVHSAAESRSARIAVATVYVEAVQVWFRCPHCQVPLEGFMSDPRGLWDISCDDCGGQFDISRQAHLVIT